MILVKPTKVAKRLAGNQLAASFKQETKENAAPAPTSIRVPELRIAFKADAATFGLISSCYFYSYALLQIPIGLTVDRFGPRRPLNKRMLSFLLGLI
jgi:MFS family permease